MSDYDYVGARIIRYNVAGKPKKTSSLEYMQLFDQDFEKRLKMTQQLKRTFVKVTTSSIRESELNEAETMAMLYIGHALLNRARFASAQKCELLDSQSDITCHEVKTAVESLINSELQYIYMLLQPLKSNEMLRVKKGLSYWLNTNCSGDTEHQDMQSNKQHLIPID